MSLENKLQKIKKLIKQNLNDSVVVEVENILDEIIEYERKMDEYLNYTTNNRCSKSFTADIDAIKRCSDEAMNEIFEQNY